jgi:serine/threonine-protein kinase
MTRLLGHDDLSNQLVLGKYRILRHLWEGTMGSLYLGRAESGGRPVIVKAIFPIHLKSSDAIESLHSELKRIIAVRHPAIAAILDAGEDNGSHFVVSEYVHGFDLAHWYPFARQQRGPFPVSVAVHIALEILRGLHHAHKSGGAEPIIHRDVMPSNVLIGNKGEVKLADFGVARIVSQGTAVMDPAMTGKLAYLTPELVTNSQPGPESDVYGVGLILHEVLSGKNEFSEGSLPATLSAVMKLEPSRLDRVRHDLPAGLSQAVAKALAKKPADRYPTASAFAEALAGIESSGGAEELARLVAEDFADWRMLELKQVPSLGDRERLLESSKSTAAAPAPRRPVRQPPVKHQERARISASGELKVRRRGESGVVWRKSPGTTAPPPVPRFKKSPPWWLIVAGLAILAIATAAIVYALT